MIPLPLPYGGTCIQPEIIRKRRRFILFLLAHHGLMRRANTQFTLGGRFAYMQF